MLRSTLLHLELSVLYCNICSLVATVATGQATLHRFMVLGFPMYREGRVLTLDAIIDS
jgi:hypothetical protein